MGNACGNGNSGGVGGAFISANSIQESIHDSLKTHIEEKKTADTQTSFSSQNITITYDYSPETMNLPPYNQKIEKYWPWGTKQKSCGAAFGCVYKIDQNANVALKTVDKDKISSKSEIFNAVKQRMNKESDDSVSGETPIIKLNDTNNLSQSVAEDSIENAVNRFKDNYNVSDEKLELVVSVPLKCPDPCSESGNEIELNQDAIIDNLINNITSETLNSINKQTDTLRSDSEESTDDTNYPCMMKWGAICLCILLILIGALYFISSNE